MEENAKILKLRVLLSLLRSPVQERTVTGIARSLGAEKYTVSRAMAALEREGYLDRSNARSPQLTESGRLAAERYSERLEITLNHLLYEGVNMESAKQDALFWALCCTDSTMRAVRATEKRYRVKYELRGMKQFGGGTLCKRLGDGSYTFPFLIFREHIRDGSNLSMANEGFTHPCELNVRNGSGTVQLCAVPISAKSRNSGELMEGRVERIRYFDAGRYVSAERNGQIFSFPAEVLQFVNVGSGAGQILHGSVCLQMECSVGPAHMPESAAIFTMLI